MGCARTPVARVYVCVRKRRGLWERREVVTLRRRRRVFLCWVGQIVRFFGRGGGFVWRNGGG